MKLVPQGENLIVRFLPKPADEDKLTPSGILMPAVANKSPMEIALILQVGQGTRHVSLDGKVSHIEIPYKEGQKVLCARRNGLLLDEPMLYLIPAGEVLAIVEE